jgi:hypothetical protein
MRQIEIGQRQPAEISEVRAKPDQPEQNDPATTPAVATAAAITGTRGPVVKSPGRAWLLFADGILRNFLCGRLACSEAAAGWRSRPRNDQGMTP